MGWQLSFSAAQRYLLSPYSYFCHYLLKLRPTESGSALFFGSALDSGFNSLLEDKMKGVPPDIEKAKAAFCQAFLKQEIDGKVRSLFEPGVVKFSKADLDESLLTELDKSSGLNPTWCSLNRKGQILIEEYAEQVLPRLEEVILVQHPIEIRNDQGDLFIGVIDLVAKIDGKIWLIDNKSTSVKYKTESANESAQLATYFEALKDDYNLAGVMYITVSKRLRKQKKPRVEIEFIPGQISEDLIDKTFNDYDIALNGIKAGHFPCSGACKKQPWGCAYSQFCESGDKTGLKYFNKK